MLVWLAYQGYFIDPGLLHFFDFDNTFDTLSHSKLLIKLQSYGINGKLHKWIGEFITDIRQYVLVNKDVSYYICPFFRRTIWDSIGTYIIFIIY